MVSSSLSTVPLQQCSFLIALRIFLRSSCWLSPVTVVMDLRPLRCWMRMWTIPWTKPAAPDLSVEAASAKGSALEQGKGAQISLLNRSEGGERGKMGRCLRKHRGGFNPPHGPRRLTKGSGKVPDVRHASSKDQLLALRGGEREAIRRRGDTSVTAKFSSPRPGCGTSGAAAPPPPAAAHISPSNTSLRPLGGRQASGCGARTASPATERKRFPVRSITIWLSFNQTGSRR